MTKYIFLVNFNVYDLYLGALYSPENTVVFSKRLLMK